jgi:hypothetical protein
MKTFKEYLLENKDFDRFIEMYTEAPMNPALPHLWEAMRLGYLADLIREDGEAEERAKAEKK